MLITKHLCRSLDHCSWTGLRSLGPAVINLRLQVPCLLSTFVTSCSLLSCRYIDSSKLETTSLLYLLLTNGASTIDDGGHGGQGLGPLQLLVAAELGRHRGGDQGVGAAGSDDDDDGDDDDDDDDDDPYLTRTPTATRVTACQARQVSCTSSPAALVTSGHLG